MFGVLNYLSEQTIGELTSGTGTIFKGTKEAQTALRGLAAATRDFVLEGRQLATELELTLSELPDAAFTTSDATTLANVVIQQKQLEDFVNRVDVLLQTPEALVGRDVSKIRLQQNFAKQLLQSYNKANDIFTGASENLDLNTYRTDKNGREKLMAEEPLKIGFDYGAARRDGATDAQIADYLATEVGFDIEAARRDGARDKDIILELSTVEDDPVGAFTRGFAESGSLAAGMTTGSWLPVHPSDLLV